MWRDEPTPVLARPSPNAHQVQKERHQPQCYHSTRKPPSPSPLPLRWMSQKSGGKGRMRRGGPHRGERRGFLTHTHVHTTHTDTHTTCARACSSHTHTHALSSPSLQGCSGGRKEPYFKFDVWASLLGTFNYRLEMDFVTSSVHWTFYDLMESRGVAGMSEFSSRSRQRTSSIEG